MCSFIDRIEAQRDELAMVIHEETGKPFWESNRNRCDDRQGGCFEKSL